MRRFNRKSPKRNFLCMKQQTNNTNGPQTSKCHGNMQNNDSSNANVSQCQDINQNYYWNNVEALQCKGNARNNHSSNNDASQCEGNTQNNHSSNAEATQCQGSTQNNDSSNAEASQSQGNTQNANLSNTEASQCQGNTQNNHSSNAEATQSQGSTQNNHSSNTEASQSQGNTQNNNLSNAEVSQSQGNTQNNNLSNAEASQSQGNTQNNNSGNAFTFQCQGNIQTNNSSSQLSQCQANTLNNIPNNTQESDSQGNQQNTQSQNNSPPNQCLTNNKNSQSQNGQNQSSQTNAETQNTNQNIQSQCPIPIRGLLTENVDFIKKVLGNPKDLIIRELDIGGSNNNQQSQNNDNSQENGSSQKDNHNTQSQNTNIESKKDNQSTQSKNGDNGNQTGNQTVNQSTQSQSNNNGNKQDIKNIQNKKTQNNQAQNDSSKGQSNNSSQNAQKCSILYISGLSDSNIVNDNILKMLQENGKQFSGNVLDQVFQEVIAITDTKKISSFEEIINTLLDGNSVLILDGEMSALEMGTAKVEKRSLDEPQSEAVIRGPRIAFIENIDTNISLIRRELKDPNLRFEFHEVGCRSKQRIAVCYVEGIVNPDILNEVNRRIKTINIDFTPGSGLVEQWIEDSFLSPFPQIIDTERPDRVIYGILQGKVSILVEGSPFALLAPITFVDAILSIEDYNQRWLIATLMRLLRYLATFIALFSPALYVALVSYHPGMLPTQLTFSIAATREGVPFPSIVEALLMAITFEILQEAGIRLPKAIGQTVGIVGGIVIGDVAVTAGIVGPLMVIITSLTAIASFTIPNYSMAIGFRIMRFSFILAAAILGLYGIIIVFIMMCVHLVNLKSMGIPYTGPFAPYFLKDLKNLIVRAPITTLTKRPPYLEPEDMQKVNSGGQSK